MLVVTPMRTILHGNLRPWLRDTDVASTGIPKPRKYSKHQQKQYHIPVQNFKMDNVTSSVKYSNFPQFETRQDSAEGFASQGCVLNACTNGVHVMLSTLLSYAAPSKQAWFRSTLLWLLVQDRSQLTRWQVFLTRFYFILIIGMAVPNGLLVWVGWPESKATRIPRDFSAMFCFCSNYYFCPRSWFTALLAHCGMDVPWG